MLLSRVLGWDRGRRASPCSLTPPLGCLVSFRSPFPRASSCNKKGLVYELLEIVPFLKKFGVDPATGDKLTTKMLTRLHFHKNNEGKYHCPVTYKVFNENTQITAIGTTGHVGRPA